MFSVDWVGGRVRSETGCFFQLLVFSGELVWELMVIKGTNKSNAAPFQNV